MGAGNTFGGFLSSLKRNGWTGRRGDREKEKGKNCREPVRVLLRPSLQAKRRRQRFPAVASPYFDPLPTTLDADAPVMLFDDLPATKAGRRCRRDLDRRFRRVERLEDEAKLFQGMPTPVSQVAISAMRILAFRASIVNRPP